VKWLTAKGPNVERAINSVRAAVEAKDMAIGVIKSLRVTFTRREVKRTEVDLADLVRATVPLLEREMASARISLQLTLDDALPPVLADRIQLQEVLINLLSNAIEAFGATERRLRQIAVRLAPQQRGGVVLEVSDNGIGIAREDMERIFDAFFTTKATGAGLGLALCRTIVEAHGGRLWASRGEQFGATLHLELPANA
jgi:signal transduction histidine kinase